MSALRAFLMMYRSPGDWNVSIHRDLKSLESEWRSRLDADSEAVAVLHTGFSRPATEDLEPIVSGLSGKLVLTDAARFALAPGHTALGQRAGSIDEMHLHVAATGWGYWDEPTSVNVTSEPELALDKGHLFYDEYWAKPDWILGLSSENSGLAKEAEKNGVVDEITYLRSEPVLPHALRESLGWERYLYYVGLLPDARGLLRNLRFAPEWLLDINISSLTLSVRSTNALAAFGASKIRHLEGPGREGLRGIDNLGSKSIGEVASEVLDTLVRGPWVVESAEALRVRSSRRELVGVPDSWSTARVRPGRKRPDVSIDRQALEPNENIVALLQGCAGFAREQHRDVLRARMGFDGEIKTLEEIGRTLGRTRERVRQIESRAITKAGAMRSWNDEVRRRLNSVLDQSSFPVPLHGLELLDSWFSGVDKIRLPFAYALKHFCGSEFALLEVDGQTVVSRIAGWQWADAVAKAREIVKGMVDHGLTEAQVRLAIEGLLPRSAQELGDAFWKEATKLAHFADTSSGRELISYGASVDHVVQAVLAEATAPLHYTEIASRCSERLGREVDVRRAHVAAANVALLFGRGTFGLQRHSPLSDQESEAIVSAAEDLIASQTDGRQWHAREIVTALEEEYPDISSQLDPYLISIVLSASEELVSLGRMVWASRSSGLKGVSHRIDVGQAVIALLQQEGRPMATSEIQSRLSEERGLSSTFQIHQGDPLIRISAGVWGLLDRDVPFSPDEVKRIVRAVEQELIARKKGIHASEIVGILEELVPEISTEHDPMLVLGLARRADSISLARGQIVFLTEWGDPRRLTLTQGVRAVLEHGGERGLTTDEVHAEVERIIERPIDRAMLPSYCDDYAEFSADSGRWRLASGEDA